jgi:cytochrome c biogenesis DsbD-like protein
MNKKIQFIVLLLTCFVFKQVTGQIVDPIHWSFSTNKISNGEYELVIKAVLEKDWHLYGQKSYGDDGPVPTSFHFASNVNYELIGTPSEETLIKKYEPLFEAELNYFEHEATFTQKVKIRSKDSIEIKGDFEFMICNESSCQPPSTVPFSFKVEGVQTSIISREIFLSFLIALFTLLGIYLIGGIKLERSKDVKYVSVPRLFLAILAFSITAYLVPGLWGAPLKLMNGITSYFQSESSNGFGSSVK